MNIIKDITTNSISEKSNIKNLKSFNKRYFYFNQIAKSDLSIVYDGIDIYNEYFKKDSNIVIKVPTKELLKMKDISAFVFSEYSFLRRLNSDSIVRVLDYGIDKKKKVPFLVLEKIEGQLLSEVSIFNLTKKDKKSIFKSLLNTLSYIHSKNIVHADISPSNIILNKNFEPIIFDFGISQNIETNDEFSLEYSKVKAFNPKYAAPELLVDKNIKPSVSTDIFSLACVMYEIFTNEALFINSSKELFDLPIEKRNLSKIPFFLRKWFKNSLSLDVKSRKIQKKYQKLL
ncbi:protein kinase domain-containing protein [Arcobacter sp. YIC-310]|uniref:protein kinase domain-containing protein n=1 Tax=Arcobacter sp. YIC-310 TaxID=3376632 RepID=UPI003C17D937